MAIKVVSIKCPECGASLPIEENRKQVFCSYCGAKILLENNNEYIVRHIDEAEVKRAETERMLTEEKLKREAEEREEAEAEKQRQLELERRKRKAHKRRVQRDIKTAKHGCLLDIIGIVLCFIPLFINIDWIVLILIGMGLGTIGFIMILWAMA